MRPQTLDLFGEVPVTRQDIDAWLIAVPRIKPGTVRASNYVDSWAVVEKIKAAKLAGTFDRITTLQRDTSGAFWWERFTWASCERADGPELGP